MLYTQRRWAYLPAGSLTAFGGRDYDGQSKLRLPVCTGKAAHGLSIREMRPLVAYPAALPALPNHGRRAGPCRFAYLPALRIFKLFGDSAGTAFWSLTWQSWRLKIPCGKPDVKRALAALSDSFCNDKSLTCIHPITANY